MTIDFNFTLGEGHGVQRVGQECEEWTKSAKSGPLECKEWDKRVDFFCRNVAGIVIVRNFEKISLRGLTGMCFEPF